MGEKGENKEIVSDNPYYGTFQGVTNYYPPQYPSSSSSSHHQQQGYHGFPGVTNYYPPQYPSSSSSSHHQQQEYHVVPVYALPERKHRLPFCGLGVGWVLFIIGWFLGGVPWYLGAFVLVFVQMDHREKPGLIACAVATLVTMMVVALGVTQADLQKLT